MIIDTFSDRSARLERAAKRLFIYLTLYRARENIFLMRLKITQRRRGL